MANHGIKQGVRMRGGKIPTKLPYDRFAEFYSENPGMTAHQMAEIFGVTETCINVKLMQFSKKNKHRFDPLISEFGKESYRQGRNEGEDRGFEKGFLTGAGLGVGVGDLLKSQGIGISDFIAGLAKVKKKS